MSEPHLRSQISKSSLASSKVSRKSSKATSITGHYGSELFKCRERVLWYIVLLFLYTIAAVEALILASSGPVISPSRRVLQTGSIKVDQFYSGLLLSAILAPVGLLVRKTSTEIALLHPFAIASRKPVSIADFDRISDPGVSAVKSVFKYSFWRGSVQSLLLTAGWLLVPIGTLMVTTGPYSPQTVHDGTIGVPTSEGVVSPLHVLMNQNASALLNGSTSHTINFEPAFDGTDQFLDLITAVFKGNLLGRADQLPLIPQEVGAVPTPSLNFTFAAGVRYTGMVTYTWESHCQGATDDISYTLDQSGDVTHINLSFPDHSVQSAMLDRSDLGRSSTMFMWSDSRTWASGGRIPRDGSTYYVVALLANTTVSHAFQPDGKGLILDRSVWVSRIRCTSGMTWRISSCIWDGFFMRNCTAAPGTNSTALDTVALDTLTKYMNAVPWQLYATQDILITRIHFTGFSPTVAHFNVLNGIIGLSVATVASMASWGTAKVQAVGESAQQVYIVRIYILIAVVCILISVTTSAIVDIGYAVYAGMPFRKTTFLTIANAVRGQWWDEELYGGCIIGTDDLRNRVEGQVMFGVDCENPKHVGLAPETMVVNGRAKYYGV